MFMKPVLVLGSRGLIGSYLVKLLRDKSLNVIEYDIAIDKSQDLRVLDGNLFRLLKESEFCYFLAFDVGGSVYLERFQDSFEFLENNMRIMTNVFHELSRTQTKFIFASSQMSNMNFSNYGLLKLIGEKITNSLENGKIVKFWNIYGREPNEKKFHVVSDFIRMASKYGKIEMKTNGQEVRNFLFGADCAEGLYQVFKHFDDIPKDAPLHIANNQYDQILDLAHKIASYYSAQVIVNKKLDSVQNAKINTPDAFILKYWKPQISLDEGLQILISQHKGS